MPFCQRFKSLLPNFCAFRLAGHVARALSGPDTHPDQIRFGGSRCGKGKHRDERHTEAPCMYSLLPFQNADGVASTQVSFFAVYSLTTTQVIALYENSSEDMLKLFEQWPCFSGTPDNQSINYVTNPSNSEFARDALRRQVRAVQKARNGGYVACTGCRYYRESVTPFDFFIGQHKQ